MRLTHEGRIARFVAKKVAALANRDYARSRLEVVLGDCGWTKRGEKNTHRIQEACEKAEIYPEPMLTTPGIAWDEQIYFSGTKPEPYCPEFYIPSPAFWLEKNLQRFLVQNYRKVPGLQHLKDLKTEFALPSRRRIDILCRERGTNAFVVIELKRAKRDPVGQIGGYLDEVREKLASRESPEPQVKGIIITGQPNAALERSLPDRISDFEVSWFLYRVKLDLLGRSKTHPR